MSKRRRQVSLALDHARSLAAVRSFASKKGIDLDTTDPLIWRIVISGGIGQFDIRTGELSFEGRVLGSQDIFGAIRIMEELGGVHRG